MGREALLSARALWRPTAGRSTRRCTTPGRGLSADETKLLTFRADAHRTLAEVLARAEDGPAAEARAGALRLYEAKGNAASAARWWRRSRRAAGP